MISDVMMTTTTLSSVVSGELCVEGTPTSVSATRTGTAVFVHGAGSNATYCLDNYGTQSLRTYRIGNIVRTLSGDNGGTQTWGNAASVTALDSYVTKAKSNAGNGKYALVGDSMGGLVALNYAAQATVKPSAIVLTIPVLNPEDIRANNRWSYASLVNAAYGGSYNEATMGSTRNPYTMRNDAKLKGIPMLIFYGATDDLCLPSFAQAFAAADPTNRTLVSLPSGHEEASYAATDKAQIVSFLEQRLR